mmetsp:Transcript_27560/g.63191  ORF Transcript_27560/g.63191 Transcript_27560/m.63191 type:complete len:93 (-) Transcript_27560:132-410(-)|eukprot:CAMPEP_0113321214 /NCGR_PEP_ID=MMETSP0010_2-20120614/14771_1 /TAXON_ID=216773 ORGANISM="Corethron hystrix, Strain 308" /NCGR_SAMPLE_ID=MMETSP0010_2 /ASSEMBLY_ACC=CAM_ASM_000155 /LENGTH=92 /DNA_ID=CAMNT_0000179269 /DNA_START=65 /DNA_END=343 /DNA_ORIENTATION=- /assembly_acc=CAM_ASM_000155
MTSLYVMTSPPVLVMGNGEMDTTSAEDDAPSAVSTIGRGVGTRDIVTAKEAVVTATIGIKEGAPEIPPIVDKEHVCERAAHDDYCVVSPFAL